MTFSILLRLGIFETGQSCNLYKRESELLLIPFLEFILVFGVLRNVWARYMYYIFYVESPHDPRVKLTVALRHVAARRACIC